MPRLVASRRCGPRAARTEASRPPSERSNWPPSEAVMPSLQEAVMPSLQMEGICQLVTDVGKGSAESDSRT
jgi:hypothetical protein